MAAGQKNDSGTFAAFHPRKQCLTEWPVLVLYAKTEENEIKMFCVDKKTTKRDVIFNAHLCIEFSSHPLSSWVHIYFQKAEDWQFI